jgi:chloride channel protein, CIC family
VSGNQAGRAVRNVRLPGTDRLRLRENQLFLALTIVIGVLAGLSAVLFALGIDLATRFFFGSIPSAARLFLVPSLVSLLTGSSSSDSSRRARQRRAADQGGLSPPRRRHPAAGADRQVPDRRAVHRVGPFDRPRGPVGADRRGARVGHRAVAAPAAGAAPRHRSGGGGRRLSAAFNTPVAAVLFALEEIIGDMNAALLGSTVVASVAAVVVQRSILGNEPLFQVPPYQLEHPAELLAYAALGVIGGALSVVFCKGLLAVARVSRPAAPDAHVQPAMGGVAIGVMLIFVPEVMGVGYEHVDQALHGGLVLRTLVLLCI